MGVIVSPETAVKPGNRRRNAKPGVATQTPQQVFLPTGALPVPDGEWPRPRTFTRAEYHRAAEKGVFGPEERLELIHGEVVVKMSPQKSPHAWAVKETYDALQAALGSTFAVLAQAPVVLGDSDEPEPDVLVVERKPRTRQRRLPVAADVKLVVEVADTTLRFDRGAKAALYAQAGISEYWILNLKDERLEVYRDPAAISDAPNGFGFRSLSSYGIGERVSPLAAPEAFVAVADLLPADDE